MRGTKARLVPRYSSKSHNFFLPRVFNSMGAAQPMAQFESSADAVVVDVLRSAAVRIGVCAGVSLSLVFTAWLVIANRVPFLEPLAVARNFVATSLLLALASIPVFRFLRSPAEMLLSSVLAWGILTLTYGALCLQFSLLDQYYSTTEIFVLGMVVYLLFATLSWIGTIIWRVRASSHPRH